jgi:hypothetical protein
MAQGTFSLSLAKFAAKAGKNADAVVRKASLDILGRIVLRSPVDTGRFRANWQLTVGNPGRGEVPAFDKTGSATIGKGSARLAQFRSGPSIWIVNNLPYAQRLEYGYSQQAPAGMVRVTQREFVSLIARAAQAVPK